MSEWIDADPTYVGSQYPLSAMVTVDWIEGNLERLYDQSIWQIQVSFHEDDEGQQSLSSADTWEVFDAIEQIPINVRQDRSGAHRALKISAEIKTSTGDETSWRFYTFQGYYGPATPSSSDGYPRGYAEITTSLSNYSWDSATISAGDVVEAVRAVPAPDKASSAPDTETPRVVLVALVSSKATGSVSMRGLHIEEVIA